jgi:hypothetical protein
MEIKDIETRLDEITNNVVSLSLERDQLIRRLHGERSSRKVAEVCGKSHAYVCRIWRQNRNG